ncbi:hypothetical protein [Xanthobacter sp. 91]|uniref:hypothetical protein n=1 Tax=Xanthobacter sp. 91 TaxID=1117244 RepID=UPI0004971E72|nr:hypothetical protein [Xanthobacter sp. 91]
MSIGCAEHIPQTKEAAGRRPRLQEIKHFCADYSISHVTAYKLIHEQAIEAVKLGRKTLIVVESADAWAASLPRMKPKTRAA